MANNYYDATGVLVLNQVTPVISALFGGFKLDASFPSEGQAYIALVAEDHNVSARRFWHRHARYLAFATPGLEPCLSRETWHRAHAWAISALPRSSTRS